MVTGSQVLEILQLQTFLKVDFQFVCVGVGEKLQNYF